MIMNKLGLLLALLIFSGSVPLSGHAAISEKVSEKGSSIILTV